MSRCVESISAKQCGKWFIPIDEAGGFGARGAGTEEEKGEGARATRGMSPSEAPFPGPPEEVLKQA
jgi:hypothetical protein